MWKTGDVEASTRAGGGNILEVEPVAEPLSYNGDKVTARKSHFGKTVLSRRIAHGCSDAR